MLVRLARRSRYAMVGLCPKGSTAQPERGAAPGWGQTFLSAWPPVLGPQLPSCLLPPHRVLDDLPVPAPHSPYCPRGPEPGLTEVPVQPLVPLDELVDECKVMGVGLVWHHPASRCNL